MSRRDQAKVARAVLDIRAVQQTTAQMQVSLADQLVRRMDGQRADCTARLEQDQRDWTHAISGGRMDILMCGAWAAEIARSEARLTDAERAMREAEAEKALRVGVWRMALASADAAKTLAAKAVTRARRHREEDALSEVADRFGRRGHQ